MPSAKEMESANGVSIGKLNSQILQKIEELTLYTIQPQKQVDELKQVKDKLGELRAEVARMKQGKR